MTIHSVAQATIADGRHVQVCISEPEKTDLGTRLRVDVVDMCGCLLASATAQVREGSTVGEVELALLHHRARRAAGVAALTALAEEAAAFGLTQLEAFHDSESPEVLLMLNEIDPAFVEHPSGRGHSATIELATRGGA
jgi:hypothetical protein